MRTTPYTSLSDQTKHFRAKRDQTVRNLTAHAEVNGSHWMLLLVAPSGVVETHVSRVFEEEKGLVESVMGGSVRRRCAEVVKRRDGERRQVEDARRREATGGEGWVDHEEDSVESGSSVDADTEWERTARSQASTPSVLGTPSASHTRAASPHPSAPTPSASSATQASTADLFSAVNAKAGASASDPRRPTLGFGEGNLSWLYDSPGPSSSIGLENTRGKMAPRSKTPRQSSEPKVAGLVGLGISNSSGGGNSASRRKREASVTTLVGAANEKKPKSKTGKTPIVDQENQQPIAAASPSSERQPGRTPLGMSGSQGTPLRQSFPRHQQEFHSPSPASQKRPSTGMPYFQSPLQHSASPTHAPYPTHPPLEPRARSFDAFSGSPASSTAAGTTTPQLYHDFTPAFSHSYPTQSPHAFSPHSSNPSAFAPSYHSSSPLTAAPLSLYGPPSTQPLPQHEFAPTSNPDLNHLSSHPSPAFHPAHPIQRTHSAPPIPSPSQYLPSAATAMRPSMTLRRPSHLSIVHMPRAERERLEEAERQASGEARGQGAEMEENGLVWQEEDVMGGFGGTPGGRIGLGIRMGGEVGTGGEGRFGDEY